MDRCAVECSKIGQCPRCLAWLCPEEVKTLPCCESGALAHLRQHVPKTPPIMEGWLRRDTGIGKRHCKDIRCWNSAFGFTAQNQPPLSSEIRKKHARGPMAFTVHGERCVRGGALLPAEGGERRYMQTCVYDSMYDASLESARRREIVAKMKGRDCDELDGTILSTLQTISEGNPLCRRCRNHAALLHQQRQEPDAALKGSLVLEADYKPEDSKVHAKRCATPTADSVAALVMDDHHESRDFVAKTTQGPLQRVSDTNKHHAVRSTVRAQGECELCVGELIC